MHFRVDISVSYLPVRFTSGRSQLADRVKAFQFCDISPNAPSENKLAHASKLLGLRHLNLVLIFS